MKRFSAGVLILQNNDNSHGHLEDHRIMKIFVRLLVLSLLPSVFCLAFAGCRSHQ